jgi:hypothetical protein
MLPQAIVVLNLATVLNRFVCVVLYIVTKLGSPVD